MKNFAIFATSIVCLFTLAGCDGTLHELKIRNYNLQQDIATGSSDLLGKGQRMHRDYSFVRETGGMKISPVVQQADGSWYLPIACDVSKYKGQRYQETDRDFSRVVHSIEMAHHKNNSIHIYIVTGPLTSEATSPYTKGVSLGKLTPGTYNLEYEDKDFTTTSLGTIEIK